MDHNHPGGCARHQRHQFHRLTGLRHHQNHAPQLPTACPHWRTAHGINSFFWPGMLDPADRASSAVPFLRYLAVSVGSTKYKEVNNVFLHPAAAITSITTIIINGTATTISINADSSSQQQRHQHQHQPHTECFNFVPHTTKN